ncbi:hypothetical protein [Polymorphospora sp. NPDC050346]|uniref:hypothetical protein n=1 Tax=Polymorphospora sp. NPDC050346 TaxID=3155780 RepID=UPI0033DE8249
MRRPNFRIACCLCGKPVPLSSDAYLLDEEWQRRYPRMVGTLACGHCTVSDDYYWTCRTSGDAFVDGHRPSVRHPAGNCHDSWNHIQAHGTHVAMVMSSPWSGLLQGAEEYLRHTSRRPGLNRDVARDLRAVIERWDAQQANH